MSAVAIIGAGLIGRSWANVFARSDWQVRLWDPHPDTRARVGDQVAESLRALAGKGLVRDADAAIARVRVVSSLEDACDGVDFVQENGPEQVDIKRDTFARLDRATAPGCILASSTSAIVASRFTEALPGRQRCLVGHPVNPPHLVPVVEICGAPWTAPESVATARAVYAGLGQSPVEVRREVEGFILNRLQGALLAEAFRLVGDGVCSPADLDRTIADGLGRRWSFLGPFATIELNAPGGIADYCARYTGFYRRLAEDPAPASVWDAANTDRIVAAWGDAPDKDTHSALTAWRDERLAALAAHVRSQSPSPADDASGER